MADRYVLVDSGYGDWWVVDTTLESDHPKKIVSAHSQKAAAKGTAHYLNTGKLMEPEDASEPE